MVAEKYQAENSPEKTLEEVVGLIIDLIQVYLNISRIDKKQVSQQEIQYIASEVEAQIRSLIPGQIRSQQNLEQMQYPMDAIGKHGSENDKVEFSLAWFSSEEKGFNDIKFRMGLPLNIRQIIESHVNNSGVMVNELNDKLDGLVGIRSNKEIEIILSALEDKVSLPEEIQKVFNQQSAGLSYAMKLKKSILRLQRRNKRRQSNY